MPDMLIVEFDNLHSRRRRRMIRFLCCPARVLRLGNGRFEQSVGKHDIRTGTVLNGQREDMTSSSMMLEIPRLVMKHGAASSIATRFAGTHRSATYRRPGFPKKSSRLTPNKPKLAFTLEQQARCAGETCLSQQIITADTFCRLMAINSPDDCVGKA